MELSMEGVKVPTIKPKVVHKSLPPYKQTSKLGKVEITCSAINVRGGPGIANNIEKTLSKGDTIEVDEYRNGWYKIKGGNSWISASPRYSKVLDSDSEPVPTKTIEETKKEKPKPDTANTVSTDENILDIDVNQLYDETYNGDPLKQINSIIGLPFQFLPDTDSRHGGNHYGRQFIENIYKNAPIVHIIPGKADFMPSYKLKEKEALLNLSLDKDKTVDSTTLDEILDGKNGEYFGFKADYATRVLYLNALNSVQAIYLGLGNEYYPGTKQKLKDFNWHKQNVESESLSLFSKLFGINPTISFFMDADANANISASNTTTKSKLDTGLNAVGDMAREIQFLTGAAGTEIDAISSANVEDHITSLNDSMINTENPASLMNRIKQGASVTITGGKLEFPEMWSDFTVGKEVSIPLKFKSPYGNKKAIFLNVLEPLNEVFSFVFGKQMTANAITSPFLVRVYAKGLINIDNGIVTGATIDKGDHVNWTVDNLPTELKVTLNIKPLKSTIGISRQDNAVDLLNNTSLLDELATLAGVDLNKPNINRKIDMYISQKTGTFKHGLSLGQAMPDFLHGIKSKFSR